MGMIVIFDLGGVLVNLDWDKVCADLRHHSDSRDVRSEVVNGPIVRSAMEGSLNPRDYHEALCQKLKANLTYAEFVEIWNGLLSANETIVSLVERLKVDHRLILASNTDPIHFAHSVEHYSVLKNFERYFLSYEMRLLKPDPAYYRNVLDALDVLAGDCVFIDDRAENVEAARGVGISSIRFMSVAQLERDLKTVL
jgi:putative hydrolase of the HAD superfamily